MNNNSWKIGIDTGGTFTDCIANSPTGVAQKIKVLSTSALRGKILHQIDKHKLKVCITWPLTSNIINGYQFRVFGPEGFLSIVRDFNVDDHVISVEDDLPEIDFDGQEFEVFANEEAPILAARIATNTPLNSPLPPMEMRLGSTIGTNALLERKGAEVCLLVTSGFKDLINIGTQQRPDLFAVNVIKQTPLYNNVIEVNERTDANGKVLNALSEKEIKRIIEKIKDIQPEAIAIALMNSYVNPCHELELKRVLTKSNFRYISISSEMANELKILPRAHTTIVNAFLSPVINSYLTSIKSKLCSGKLRVMTSFGGLVDSEFFRPKDSLLSGPAGGVVGAARIAKQLGEEKIITFDMGGTSTDVSRIDENFDYSFESEIDGISIFSPVLSIETVAAGGGSICSFDGFKLKVGPDSAGASPGPACYGAGGPLTITDINYLLGRLDEENFGIPINIDAARNAFQDILVRLPGSPNSEKILTGFLQIANEKMTDAIKKISFDKGYNPSDFTLLAFGGAGGQNACALADLLGMQKIIVPFDAGLLSAYGMGMAEIERFAQRQMLRPLHEIEDLTEIFYMLEREAFSLLQQEKIPVEDCYIKVKQVFMRLKGQENSHEIIVEKPDNLRKSFKEKYTKIYGHWLENEVIEIESIKIVAAGKSEVTPVPEYPVGKYIPPPEKTIKTLIQEEWKDIPVYSWESLQEGAEIIGPSLLLSSNSTLLIDASWKADIKTGKNVLLTKSNKNTISITSSPQNEFAELELFTNRFRSVASNMGSILRRSSFSVNVKERLDFSCAVMDARGYLVANAPHIPVHLGSLGICTRSIIKNFKLGAGDIIITNHPAFGGSHLPDVTLISAAYDSNNELIGYVANRAHHAEWGGKTPGSMPADAKSLSEEGVVVRPCYLVRDGNAQWQFLKDLLKNSKYPSRSVEENIADLNGAIASINTGVEELRKLSRKYSTGKVKQYMDKLQVYASECVENAFKSYKNESFEAREFLDDGHCIAVKIQKKSDKIIFDFSGTSAVHPGNLNATPAILNSAIIYVLRLMVKENIPLNEGIMKKVEIIIPENSLLSPVFDENPEKCPAVVGGNTEISQRLVDTLIKALGISACSQGTMNNLIFGNKKFGFYETICGGTGAGEGFHGADAVHHHMTNTKITDPEVLEKRYPVRLEQMEIREGSGGKGKWAGGKGVVRKITFLEDVSISVLTQHRREAPFGIDGGDDGKTGKQYIIKKNGDVQPLQGIDGATLAAGDAIVVKTPGGGGWGKA